MLLFVTLGKYIGGGKRGTKQEVPSTGKGVETDKSISTERANSWRGFILSQIKLNCNKSLKEPMIDFNSTWFWSNLQNIFSGINICIYMKNKLHSFYLLSPL